MQRKRILFLGYGDIAERIAKHQSEHELVGVARSPKSPPEYVTFKQAAADSMPVCEMLRSERWDAVIITLTPTEFSDRAYDIGYVQTLAHLLTFMTQNPPGLVIFTSSTSVYSQSDGEWVDEDTCVEPASFSGKRMYEAEGLLQQSGLHCCILRVAGIYGPGREVLIRQVKQGQGGSSSYTNRIHSEDCAGFVSHILSAFFEAESIAPLYVVSDGNPVSGRDLRLWLAQMLGLEAEHLAASVSERGGNKRCRNQKMLDSGYQLIYPDYREGYREMLGVEA